MGHSSNNLIIIGAGMSGLLCGALNPGSIIYEAGPERESDHKALFRCKSPQIGKMLGIPFKEVEVYKSIWLDHTEVHATPRIAHMYSQKVAGKISGRSITNIESGIRYIPPDDFINQLKSRCKIFYETTIYGNDMMDANEPIISTIPLFRMMNILGHGNKGNGFSWKKIYVNRIKIPNCDSYCSVYYPDPTFSAYRASITGNILIIEGMEPLQNVHIPQIYQSLGLPFEKKTEALKSYIQKMGKITPIDDRVRHDAITEITLKYGIYSLGRFATWRPKVMLDDVLDDIFVIRRLIENGKYESLRHQQS